MQAVGHIGLRGAGIEIEEEDREVGEEVFVPALDTFADDMVGYATKRLERDHFLDTVLRKVANLAGQEPSLTEVRSGVDDLPAGLPDVHDVRERSIERENAAEPVVTMRHMLQQRINKTCLPRAESVRADVLRAVDEGVRDGGREETGDGRWYHFDALANKPTDDILVAERVVFDVYLADESNNGHLFGGVTDVGKSLCRLTHEMMHGAIVTLLQKRLNGLQVVIVERSRFADFSLSLSVRQDNRVWRGHRRNRGLRQ